VALAKSLGRDPCELAIAWVLAQGEHVLAIPGTRYPENLAANARAADKPLTKAEAEALARVLPVGWAAGDRYTDVQWNNIERYC
jgi:aryl-alcohol dehydrogenase-like predicted oxidoreductase